MKLTDFKRGLMKALIDDENCLKKLILLLNNTQAEAYHLELRAAELRMQQQEIEDLLKFLNSPVKKED